MTQGSGTQEPAATGGAASRAPIDCAEALSKLFAFLDAEIAEAEGDRIRQHLADCEPCLNEYDVEDHLKKLVKRSCSDPAPAELHQRIRAQLVVLQERVARDPQ